MIPTAQEFFNEKADSLRSDREDMPQWMIEASLELVRLHVQAALEAAAENAEITYTEEKTYDFTFVDKQSILNSYPLKNIK